MDCVPNQLDDPVAVWDSSSGARDAHTAQSGDLIATATDWASRAKRHVSSFYLANPARIKQLAKGGKAVFAMQTIYLDETPVITCS
jgi:hypothetical protein